VKVGQLLPRFTASGVNDSGTFEYSGSLFRKPSILVDFGKIE
jgi:hypothetical protein